MPHKALTILIADDDYEDMELIETAITEIDPNISLEKASNAQAVIMYLSSQPEGELPSLIVLDYNMPDLTGFELLKILDKEIRYEKIPKLILSTSNASEHVRNCLSNGAREYFVKPNNMQDLSKVARKMLSYCQ